MQDVTSLQTPSQGLGDEGLGEAVEGIRGPAGAVKVNLLEELQGVLSLALCKKSMNMSIYAI